MRFRAVAVLAVLVVALCGLTTVSLARTSTSARARVTHYSGRAGAGDAYPLSFVVVRGHVRHFTFVSRCPGLRNGTSVAASMRIVKGHFSFRNRQFRITGRFLKNGMARGTERDITGDCDSGLLDWAARRS